MADALPEPALAALEDPFAQLTGPLASTTRLDFEVVDSARLTPHMQRLRLTAPQLDGFGYLPGQDVMLLVAAEGNRPVRRRYTIRQLDAAARLLTLDIVLHGDGPGERWVRSARSGDKIEGIGPRGKITTSATADWHLFIGDESALPATFAMTEALPPDRPATLVLEIPDESDEQDLAAAASIRISWLHRPRRARWRPVGPRRRGSRDRAAARPRPRLPVRRGDGRVPAAGGPGRARARPGPDVTQGLLGPRPRQRQPRRARPRRLADGGDGRGDLRVHLRRDREPGADPADRAVERGGVAGRVRPHHDRPAASVGAGRADRSGGKRGGPRWAATGTPSGWAPPRSWSGLRPHRGGQGPEPAAGLVLQVSCDGQVDGGGGRADMTHVHGRYALACTARHRASAAATAPLRGPLIPPEPHRHQPLVHLPFRPRRPQAVRRRCACCPVNARQPARSREGARNPRRARAEPPGRQAGLVARPGSRTPEPGSVLGGEAQPGCGGGVAELGDRLGPGTVHPGEIGLGQLGELLHGDIPGRGQRLPGWPGPGGGRAGAGRACGPVTR